jgi:hypothetical protein
VKLESHIGNGLTCEQIGGISLRREIDRDSALRKMVPYHTVSITSKNGVFRVEVLERFVEITNSTNCRERTESNSEDDWRLSGATDSQYADCYDNRLRITATGLGNAALE